MFDVTYMLTILLFLPLAGALLLLPVWERPALVRVIAVVVGLLELLLASACWLAASAPVPAGAPAGFFLFTDAEWIPAFGVRYILGMDGISLLMVILTALVTLVAMLVSWRAITERTALHYVLLLVMETGIIGVFLSLDLFLFYLFWEVMLIPMFFLIGIWGHGRNLYSAVKFFLFTLAGSLLMLLAIIGIYLLHGSQSGLYSFALMELVKTAVPFPTAIWLYGAFLLAFAVKFPLLPLHTWLPDAHTDAPTAGSVILAALLLKTGAYGLIRFGYPLFPEAARAYGPLLLVLAVAGILYASWIAFAQTDLKRLIAYSSIAHMGFVALGIGVWRPVALSGSLLQMVNHGLTTTALFALVGMLDERAHSREISTFGGLWGKIPRYSFFLLFFAMASAGMPGLNNFTGEFLILAGSFRMEPLFAVLALLGIILPLVYTVRFVQEVLFQTEREPLLLTDLRFRETGLLVLLALADIYLGLHPAPLLAMIRLPVALLTGVAP
jgi:NADH-quinone oxidoreductase subunit M